MELTDVLALAKAGYSKEEIALFTQTGTPAPSPAPVAETAPSAVPAQGEAPAPVPTPTPAPTPTPTPTPVPAPVPAPTPEQKQPSMMDIMQSIAKLTSAVQANALAQTAIPQGVINPPSAEDMLAEIIRPTFQKRSE